jgi:hypothetical protein
MWYSDNRLKKVLSELHKANNKIYCLLMDATGRDGMEIVFKLQGEDYKITIYFSSRAIDQILNNAQANYVLGKIKGAAPSAKFDPHTANMAAWLENRYHWEMYDEDQAKKKARTNSFTGGYSQSDGRRGSTRDWKNNFKEATGQQPKVEIPKSPQQILELDPFKKPTADELKKAYRTACMKWHPDRNQHQVDKATEMMKVVNEAYNTLKSSYGYS